MQSNHILLYLWKLRTLFMGELDTVGAINTAATTYLVGLEKPFNVIEPNANKRVAAQTLLVPAGQKIEVDTGGQLIAMCYLDPYGSDLRHIQASMQQPLDSVFLHNQREQDQIQLLQTLYHKQEAPNTAYNLLTQQVFLGLKNEDLLLPTAVNSNILRAIALIQNDPASNISNEALAKQCNLTTPQLQRWFKRTTGLPVRRYRLWHRLFVTANNMAKGMSLTDAAYDAGFSDSAHFNHTFRSLLGITPSMVFKPKKALYIYSESNQSAIAGNDT